MVVLNSPCPLNCRFQSFLPSSSSATTTPSTLFISTHRHRHRQLPSLPISSFSVCSQHYNRQQATSTPTRQRIDKSLLDVSEAHSDSELWAAACLRVRSFYNFPVKSFGIEDHKKYLAEREFEALKERTSGKRAGYKRVSCINATFPLSQLENISDDLCSFCKLSSEGENRVVVGTLDLNQCLRLQEEITGKKPKGIGADFARAYISNVCVAKELYRNGLGYALIAKSKMVAEEWGISDLYVHVAIDNEPAKNLYLKSGFVFESEEPAWKARFQDRPRRLLLWTGLPITYELQ